MIPGWVSRKNHKFLREKLSIRYDRRSFANLWLRLLLFATRPVLGAEISADDSLRSDLRRNADLLGLQVL